MIAVGTTVVRALESVAQPDGRRRGRRGLDEPCRHARARAADVDGLLTGWHEPEASHLRDARGLAGDELLERSYREALEQRYLWHEFGDSHLLLGPAPVRRPGVR